VTRDRREGEGRIGDLPSASSTPPGSRTRRDGRSRTACASRPAPRQADLVLFMIDARAGVTPLDAHFAQVAAHTGRRSA
jgi:GTP-binding protein